MSPPPKRLRRALQAALGQWPGEAGSTAAAGLWRWPAWASLALLASCASGPPGGGVACGQLPSALRGLDRLDITVTRNVAADDKSRPAHCLVTGKLNERQGDDGKRYAIGFEMRLPQNWNQRFLHQVNGGNDGVVVPAFGP